MVAGFLLYAPRRSTIFEAHEQEGVAGMSTVALRSSSWCPGTSWPPGREHDEDLHSRPQPGPGRGPEPRRPDVPVMSLVPQRLAVYHGPRGGGLRKMTGIPASPCRVGLIGRDIQNYAVR